MIIVKTNHSGEITYAAATKWHVDDNGQLHVVGPADPDAVGNRETRNLGSHATGTWDYVSTFSGGVEALDAHQRLDKFLQTHKGSDISFSFANTTS